AYISLWILVILYVISLGAELICNDTPLYVRFEERSYFPIVKFYPDDTFTASGKQTRPKFHQINNSPVFTNNAKNYMIFPAVAFGPYESVDEQSIETEDDVMVRITPMAMIGTVNIRDDYTIARSVSFGPFMGKSEKEVKNLRLTDFVSIPDSIQRAIDNRIANEDAPAVSDSTRNDNGQHIAISLSTYSKRKRSPKTVRLTFKESIAETTSGAMQVHEIKFDRKLNQVRQSSENTADEFWQKLSEDYQKQILNHVQNRFLEPQDKLRLKTNGRIYNVAFIREDIRFPFRPVKGHIMGIDGAGRDVFARILYGMRTSMTFGLLLVFASMILGIISGALQGYYGGAVDITGQRLIEIWSALPFLYIMILMGNVFGRSFSLLLVCYGVFNWIGISYYMRAEFLRLRKQPFVEAAKCMGIASPKIIFKHILPNGLVPIVTFFPFSLVAAISALAALDYLGFGLPPPTPSWGELLAQAQQYRWAWWLILYPSLALFIVMLLGVFIGEGIRNAYDPKRYSRLE
ncbi:MAG: ABC transporter permease subunit, partial [Planctomycetota bacterium]